MTTVYASTNPTAYTKIHIYCTCVYSNNTQHMCQCCVLLQISYTVVDVHSKVHAPADSTHTQQINMGHKVTITTPLQDNNNITSYVSQAIQCMPNLCDSLFNSTTQFHNVAHLEVSCVINSSVCTVRSDNRLRFLAYMAASLSRTLCWRLSSAESDSHSVDEAISSSSLIVATFYMK